MPGSFIALQYPHTRSKQDIDSSSCFKTSYGHFAASVKIDIRMDSNIFLHKHPLVALLFVLSLLLTVSLATLPSDGPYRAWPAPLPTFSSKALSPFRPTALHPETKNSRRVQSNKARQRSLVRFLSKASVTLSHPRT